MAQCSLNAIPATYCRLSLPRFGLWYADIDLGVQYQAPFGTPMCSGFPVPKTGDLITVTIDNNVFKGAVTVVESQVYSSVRCRVVGGNGGLIKTSPTKNFGNGPTTLLALTDMLAGEPPLNQTLSLPQLVNFYFLSFTTFGTRTVAENVSRLCNVMGCAWRLDPTTGAVILVIDSYATPTLLPTHASAIDDAHTGEVSFQAPALDALPLPGTLGPDGRQVQEVIIYVIGPELSFTLSPIQASTLLAKPTNAELFGTYSATVTGQAGKLLNVTYDDPRIAGTGAQSLSYMPGAGITLGTITPGTKVIVSFVNGDPTRPFIIAWDGTSPATVQLSAQGTVTLSSGNDFVALATLVKGEFSKIQASMLTGATPSGGGKVTFADPYTAGDVAAEFVKAT